jgi:hypothetical protein
VPETLSTAVLRSLEGDPTLRYSTARQLSTALRAGVAGREPPGVDADAPTQSLAGGTTAATRHLPAPEPTTPVARQAPAPRAAPRPRPAAQPAAGRPRRSLASRLGSAIGILLVIALLAAVVAGVVLLTTNAGKNTDLIKKTIPDQVHSLEDFIRSHTQ